MIASRRIALPHDVLFNSYIFIFCFLPVALIGFFALSALALAITGIRERRQRPVIHSPNVFAPVEPAGLPLGPSDDPLDAGRAVGGIA